MRISARHAILLDNRMQALGSSGSSRSSQWDFEVLNVSVSRTLSVERRMIMGMLCSILKPNTRNGVWTHMSSGLAQGNHFDDVRMFREIYNLLAANKLIVWQIVSCLMLLAAASGRVYPLKDESDLWVA